MTKILVLLMLNSECNACCKHCYLEYFDSRDPENALKTVKKLQNNGYEVDIAGSETLLRFEYLKVYQAAGIHSLLSNGIILDKDKSVYDLLFNYQIRELELSIHFGIGRNLKSPPESLVSRVLRESKKRGFMTTINTVITSVNYGHILKMCDKAAEYRASKIQFIRFVMSGRGRNLAQNILTQKQVDEVYKQIDRAREKYSLSILEIRMHGNFGPRTDSKRSELAVKENTYCPAGRTLMVVDPQDKVYGCPFCMQLKNSIGKLVDGKIIINKELFEGKRDTCIAHFL